MNTRTLLPMVTVALAAWGAVLPGVAHSAVSAADAEFFEKKIRPVLVSECYECHGAQKPKGGLRLDYREGWMKGGESGPVIIPGEAAKSLFIQSIQHTHSELKMPKKRAKLADAVIQDLVTWVNKGAPDPRDHPPSEQVAAGSWDEVMTVRKQWWSFQPVKEPAVPKVKDAKWSSEPVDKFILAKLEEKGLAPAKQADKRTLIRRATFVLTGLPPTPEEVNAFIADTSPKAFEKVVDRLLASPSFGEQWARHWMDLVRYAETHGSENDPDIRDAWRYRDYLIRAFNADVPDDQLIKEHIAGDLLAKPRINAAEGLNESRIGIASLRLNEHGFQPIDTLDEQVKTVENQIDVVTKAFQGLTVSCARCHDHKFDPISQKDFYAMYGVLASSRPAQVMVDAPEVLNKNKAELAALKPQVKSALAEAWLKSVAEELPAKLKKNHGGLMEVPPEMGHLSSLVRWHEQLASARVWEARGKNPAVAKLAQPLAQWSFDGDAKDSKGNLNGELRGGAVIKNGRLILNGTDAFMESVPLKQDLKEKTLEAWVYLSNLQQRAGGVITTESIGGRVFDAVVFAEKESRQWVPGSNNFKRSQTLGGPQETASPNEAIHLAVTYAADGNIAFYRNGKPYGAAYSLAAKQEELAMFTAGQAHVLLGRRHTGGGMAFLAGEIEEGRLYNRALSAEEVGASFSAGPGGVSKEDLLAVMTPQEKTEYQQAAKQLAELKRQQESIAASKAGQRAAFDEATRNEFNPLYAWVKFNGLKDQELADKWTDWMQKQQAELVVRQQGNASGYVTKWNLAKSDDAQWFREGQNLPAKAVKAGEFSLEADGVEVVNGIYPAGIYSHLLTKKHGALFTSPRFKIETDSISVKVLGGGGAMVRVIVDNYPLPMNPIYPKAILTKDEPGWVRLDTAYRKGSWAYLEFGTFDDLTRPLATKDTPVNGRSWFGVEHVVFHNSNVLPKDEVMPALGLSEMTAPKSADELVKIYQSALTTAIKAWQSNTMTEPQRALLDYFVRRGLLPNDANGIGSNGASLIATYRKLEAEVPVARRAPGVLETVGEDAPLMPRGDHLKPGDLVPRGFLQVLGKADFGFKGDKSHHTGRLELAESIADAKNPLTARVMANRIWQHLFGRGIVATVDNFGRLGAEPTHPELLDHLATQLVKGGWSEKKLIRTLMLSQAWQQSSEPSEKARQLDAANDLLSHYRVRRLEAESIRDSLLAVAGKLEAKQFGPPVFNNVNPRRSVYLAVRRTNLNPFLEVFDAPKPFTTLGQRDATNVPAQSLTLLNDPFVIGLAQSWAKALIARDETEEARVRRMFELAFARTPSAAELKQCAEYLAQLGAEKNVAAAERLKSEAVWQDFAQSLFNLKEFIYIR
ncbi:MAG TPA: DUF1553 domain-containing protein [Verrucomicrobiae bacterium]